MDEISLEMVDEVRDSSDNPGVMFDKSIVVSLLTPRGGIYAACTDESVKPLSGNDRFDYFPEDQQEYIRAVTAIVYYFTFYSELRNQKV